MKALILTFLIAVSACAAEPMRLSEVKKIHVGYLGDNGIRERLIVALTQTGKFQVVEFPADADAEVVGIAGVTSDRRAAVFNGAAAARTVTFMHLTIRLQDKNKNTLWAYDGAKDRKGDKVDSAVKKLVKDASKPAKK